MKIENERIVEATETELYSYWLKRDYCDFYPFDLFLEEMKLAGVNVIEDVDIESLENCE